MPFWTVARTHPNSEKIAIDNLKRQDFIYYQPKILERKLRKQRIQYVEAPLFPCYLFVYVIDKWRSLHSTHGIAALLGGSSPSIVRNDVIDDLRAREHNGIIQLPKLKQFEIGDKVSIQSGAFAGHLALVERMPSKERQKILLALLSNKIRVLVAEDDLIAA
jgi:transcriptional antiterminator RfaH